MLTDAQVREAIAQMRSHTQLVEAGYKAGVRDYEMLSARQVLRRLGYNGDDVDQVIRAIAAAGFNYCLDPIIPSEEGGTPSYDVCFWGVDQLRSRLDCVSL